MTWPLYRIGDTVFIQNWYIDLKENGLTTDFSLEKLYSKIPGWLPKTMEAKHSPSEWSVTLNNLEEWAAHLTG